MDPCQVVISHFGVMTYLFGSPDMKYMMAMTLIVI